MKKIFSVGQCSPDHSSLQSFFERNFECNVKRIDSKEEALQILEKEKPDLLIVNRKLDIDYTDGTELIIQMKKNPSMSSVPVMLVSNYPEYQEEAVRLGAVYGFGKAELQKKETLERVSQILNRKETL